MKLKKKLIESSLFNIELPKKNIGLLYNFILKLIKEKLKKDLKKKLEKILIFPSINFKNFITLLPKFLIG